MSSIEASNRDEQHLQDLTNAIREKMVQVAKTTESKSSASIYRVPAELRKLKESAYTPRLVSIGPLHSGDHHLKSYTQDMKKSYANSLIRRVFAAGGRSPEQREFDVLKECVAEMQKSKDTAKKYYAERVDALDEEMLVIDGCFILELLYRSQIRGVKFTKVQGFFKRWSKAPFHIPTLSIYDSTEPFLRNLIALEQCCPGVSKYFTSYAFLMDTLVSSAKDVQVLSKARVAVNFLRADEEASDLFNNLCKEIVLAEFYFAEPCSRRGDKYSKHFWPNAMAHIRRRYFATPWTFIAMCVGFVAFAISVLEFVRSLYKSPLF